MKKYYNLFKKELLSSCVPFWLKHSIDKENGGIINCVDRFGDIYSNDKSVWMQGRCAWTFSYIYNEIEKNEEYLNTAKSCIDFLNSHCIDKDGRMYFTVTIDGKPLRKRRYFFSETFYIIANAEYYKATKDTTCLNNAKKYFKFVYEIYKNPSLDPYKITPKSYSDTRNVKSLANPMILLNVACVLKGADAENIDYYDNIISGLIEDVKVFYKPEYKATFENINADDNSVILETSATRVINPGHDIECAWFLLEEAATRKDESLILFAKEMFDNALSFGWDKKYGGILYFKDVLNKPVEAYEHDMKLWWPHNEAVIASLYFYYVTKDVKYKKIFKKITKYAFKHFSDKKYGEWFGYLRRDGKPTEPIVKGHTYKGPFHVMRMLAKCLSLMDKYEKNC